MWFRYRKPFEDPLALSRQVRRLDAIRAHARRRVIILSQWRWYHGAAALALLVGPLVQYVGYLSTGDMHWFYYPLAVGVLVWVAINVVAPTTAYVKPPLSLTRVTIIGGNALLLFALASAPKAGLVTTYRAVTFDLLVIATATSTVSLLNFARFKGSVR